MNNKFEWTFKQHFIVSIIITIVTIFTDIITGSFGVISLIAASKSFRTFTASESSALAIIGGADGPTVLFSSGNPFSLLLYSKLIMIITLLLLFIPTKKFIFKMTKH